MLYAPPLGNLLRMPHPRARCLILLLAIAAALAGAPLARAQQPQPALSINQVDAAAYPDIRAVVTPLDAAGVPERGLTPAQFQAFDGDTALAVTAVEAAQDANVPLSVVVAIDVSGSMAGEPLARAKQAATQFVQDLAPGDEAAIVSFNSAITMAVAFTGDKGQLASGIAQLRSGGATALFDAVQFSAFVARSTSSPRRAVVLLTDGQNDTGGAGAPGATEGGSVNAARDAGAPIFTVGFGAAPDAEYLAEISTATHAQYRAATTATVASVYADIAALLRAQYVLTLQSAVPADGKQAALRIVATVGGAPAAAASTYTRGKAPALVQATPVVTPAQAPAAAIDAGGSSRVPLIVFSALVGLILAAVAVVAYARWRRQRRILRHQLDVVEPNQRQAAAQGLPEQPAAVAGPRVPEIGHGRLIEMTADGPGRVHELGGGPVLIGSNERTCGIVLAESENVAPEHVSITLRDGKYRLRHAGGRTRRTLVAGREADIVTLEPGDEIQVGRWHFVFEDDG
jgi:VWFA-related protein